MRIIKVAIPAAIVIAGMFWCTTATFGKQEYAKKTGKKCTDCHAKVEGKDAMPKNLTDMGKYYRDHDHSLDGYQPK